MPLQVDDRYDQHHKNLTTYVKLASTSLGVVLSQPLHYHAVRRLIHVTEGDELEANEESEDALAELLVEAAHGLHFEEEVGARVVEVDAAASVAALFDPECSTAKAYKPLLFLAIDVRSPAGVQGESGGDSRKDGARKDGDGARICGLATVCEWVRDATLGTERWTKPELAKAGAPRLDSSWLLIDVIASRHRGCGVLLAVQVYLMVTRSRKHSGVVALAVTKAGRDMFAKLGFSTHTYRASGQSITLCYARAGTLSLQRIRRRLSFSGDQVLLDSLCWREGYTSRTSGSSGKVYSRC